VTRPNLPNHGPVRRQAADFVRPQSRRRGRSRDAHSSEKRVRIMDARFDDYSRFKRQPSNQNPLLTSRRRVRSRNIESINKKIRSNNLDQSLNSDSGIALSYTNSESNEALVPQNRYDLIRPNPRARRYLILNIFITCIDGVGD